MSDRNRNPAFETARLRLRMPQSRDEEFLASLYTDPEVMQYFHPGPLSQSIAVETANAQIEMAPHRFHLHKWIVELRDHGTTVGWIELGKFRRVFDPDECRMSDDVSLSYQLARPNWNRGFASEAARPVLAYAFHTLRLDRVVALAHTDNIRSKRVLEKLGFRQHATRRYGDESGPSFHLYAVLASDW
jgi:[ribosomal protein S5]-alanine N-acetyltransferase